MPCYIMKFTTEDDSQWHKSRHYGLYSHICNSKNWQFKMNGYQIKAFNARKSLWNRFVALSALFFSYRTVMTNENIAASN